MERCVPTHFIIFIMLTVILSISTVSDTGAANALFPGMMPHGADNPVGSLRERAAGSDVSVYLIPQDPAPLDIPAGESFDVTVRLVNHLEEVQIVDLWIMARLPNGVLYGPIQQWTDIQLNALGQQEIPVQQNIPGWAPRLKYDYLAYAGDYPANVSATDALAFRVLPERGAVELRLLSPQQNGTFGPGETIEWKIRAGVSTLENLGLALISVDLVQDPGNPERFNLPAGDGAPAAMRDFDRPKGLTNPDLGDPWGSGYGGIPVGEEGQKNLLQIGGSQNTFGVRGPCLGPNRDVCTGQDVQLDEGIGHAPAGLVIATGAFEAPDTPGTYTFHIESPVANTVAPGAKHPLGVTPVLPAPVVLLKPSFSFHVSGGAYPSTHGATRSHASQAAAAREVVILPPEGSLMNRLHLRFRWAPFDLPPAEYKLWIVEDDLSGDPFNSGRPVLSFQADGSEPRTTVTGGLAFGTPYAWCVTDGVAPTSPVGEIGPTHRFTTLALPDWLPDITATHYGAPGSVQPGLTLIRGPKFTGPDTNQYLLMINEDGDVVYYLDTKTQFLSDLRLLETEDGRNGHLMAGKGRVFEFTLDGKILWISPDNFIVHHEASPMPNGNVIALTHENRTVIINDEPVTKTGDRIIELDRWTRDVVWDWSTFDHYSVEDGDESPNGNPDDWTHSNSVVYDEALNRVYISVRHLSRVSAIDYATGDIIYNMGKNWSDTHFGHNLFTAQHAIQLLPNGNMMLYDNGNWREPLADPRQTKAIELAFYPDHISPTSASIVWEYGLEDDAGDPLFFIGMGDADRLPNGNTISTGRHLYTIWEANAQSELVWKLEVHIPQGEQNVLYRAEKIAGMHLDTPGDSDGDQDLDLRDFAQAQAGYTGEGPVELSFPYTLSDFDGDGDLDLYDLGNFSVWITGPGQ